jgi:predicted NACHT family NTPase
VNYTRRVPTDSANEEIDGEAILKAMESRHGILVERTHRVYSFSHLTFQEYFAAKFIASNTAKGSVENLVQKHCADVRWREVFLLTTSLLGG